jgi:hypothetical protein
MVRSPVGQITSSQETLKLNGYKAIQDMPRG